MNVTITCLLLGFEPTWVPAWYTAQVAFFLPYRFCTTLPLRSVFEVTLTLTKILSPADTYKKKLFHYFLFDFCYLVNALCLIYVSTSDWTTEAESSQLISSYSSGFSPGTRICCKRASGYHWVPSGGQ